MRCDSVRERSQSHVLHTQVVEAAMTPYSSIDTRKRLDQPPVSGAPISGAPFADPGNGAPLPLLDAAETAPLARIASIVGFAKGARLYEEGEKADSLYNIIKGEAKTFCALSSGRRRVTAFLLPGDLAGFGEDGLYVCTAQALTPVTAYRLPLHALNDILRSDPALEHRLLCKLWHDLRAAQSHAIMLGRRDAQGKLAMFLQERRAHNPVASPLGSRIVLPMTRSDVADYLGLSLETVSRSFHKLQQDGIIGLDDRHGVRIVDRPRFEKLVAAT
jgi:CRP/FNR family transcriptional regulator, anaerobic regulatory protein